MGIEALLSTQIIDTTTVGRAVMTAADAAAARTAIGAGTSSFSGAYSALSGIPSTFAPSAHKTSHATGGSDALTAADIGAAATSHTHAASDITSGIIATARLATGTASASTYLRGDQTWASVSAGVGGSTGSVDNGVLRADGTGGSTVQSSDWIIADNYTVSPNNTVNHASLQATGGTTNVSVSVVPKGTGSFSLHVPDATAAGGNVRGANAIDLQTLRDAANKVASGLGSVVLGSENRASGQSAIAIGRANTATAQDSHAYGIACNATSAFSLCFGYGANASNYGAIAIGQNATASGNQAVAIGTVGGVTASGDASYAIGENSAANRERMHAMATGRFAANGDAQEVKWVLRNKTTDGTTAVTLFANGSSTRCLLTSGKVLHANVLIVGSKSDGSAVAIYARQVAIKNVGGTTTLVGTVNTVGTDTAAGTTIAITADNTNSALQIAVTGVAGETWRWVATVVGPELAYGT